MNLKVWYNIIIFHIIHHIQFSIFDQEYKISMMLQTVWIQYTGEIDKICWKCGIHIGLLKFEIPSGTIHVTSPYSVPPQCSVQRPPAVSLWQCAQRVQWPRHQHSEHRPQLTIVTRRSNIASGRRGQTQTWISANPCASLEHQHCWLRAVDINVCTDAGCQHFKIIIILDNN